MKYPHTKGKAVMRIAYVEELLILIAVMAYVKEAQENHHHPVLISNAACRVLSPEQGMHVST